MYKTQPIKIEIDIAGFNSICYFEFGKDFSHSPEQHGFWEMVYVDNGKVVAITDGQTRTLSQGQVIFHKPHEMHSHTSDRSVANNMLVISFTTSSEITNFLASKIFTLDKTGKTLLSLFLEEAKTALGSIPGDYENNQDLYFLPESFGSSQLLGCYFTEFLIHLIRSGHTLSQNVPVGKKTRNITNNSLCELICEHMKENIYSSLTLGELCGRFIISKTQLCKIFKENIGQSPMDYYMELKIKEAKKLLREKNYSVSQIADMLGYSSIHIFSRAFKKAAGFSPTAYVKSIL